MDIISSDKCIAFSLTHALSKRYSATVCVHGWQAQAAVICVITVASDRFAAGNGAVLLSWWNVLLLKTRSTAVGRPLGSVSCSRANDSPVHSRNV
jgi:hypothetical protein